MLVLRCLLPGGEVGPEVQRVRFAVVVVGVLVKSHHLFKSARRAFEAYYKAEAFRPVVVVLVALIKGQPEFELNICQ